MLSPSQILKKLRASRKLSQRQFAKRAAISFRQLQRVEREQSDITIGKLVFLLNRFGLELAVRTCEPDWRILCYFGLPIAGYGAARGSIHKFLSALVQAIFFSQKRK